MTTASIRQRLHSYLEVADDKKIKAFYALMKDEIEGSGIEYTDELKMELDKRYSSYKSGQGKMVNAAQSKKRIKKILKGSKRKVTDAQKQMLMKSEEDIRNGNVISNDDLNA